MICAISTALLKCIGSAKLQSHNVNSHFMTFNKILFLLHYLVRAVHSGGAKGAVAPARKTKCFFSNIVSDFAGLFLVAILVRNLTKTEFAPADKKS